MTNGLASNAPGTGAITVGKSLRVRWWSIAVPLLIIGVVAHMDRASVAMVMGNKQFLQDLKLVGRPAVTGLLMSGFLLTYAVCPIFWGYFVKKYGPRICAIMGIIVWGGAMALSGIAQTAGALIAARVVLGAGEAFLFPAFNTFVVNWFPPKERARASSLWLSGMNFGPAVAGALVVALVTAWGWRMSFFTLAALSIVLPLPLLIFLIKDRPSQQKLVSNAEARFIEEASSAKTKEVAHITAAKEKESYLLNYRFWLVALAWGFNNIFYWGWATWMPTYFQTVRHFSFQSAGYIYSLNWLFTILSVLIVGYYSDRVMRRAPFGAAGWIIGGILFFVGGTFVDNAYWALVVLVIALAVEQSAFLSVHTLLQSIVPKDSMGAAVGVASTLAFLIGMISPPLVGFLVQVSGFGAVIVVLASGAVIPGILVTFLIREGY